MPITTNVPIRCLSQDDFHATDRVMLGHAFKIHNEYGRLLDESVYKALLAERCMTHGIQAIREVHIQVQHQKFSKSYFIDLLLGSSTIVEVKTAQSLTLAHRGQGINYLLLANTHHGSLVNFRGTKVARDFLSTNLSHETRKSFITEAVHWPNDFLHLELEKQAESICRDIGLGLDTALYRDALISLFDIRRCPVPVMSGPRIIGNHEIPLLTPDIGLVVTGLPRIKEYHSHLKQLLFKTPLKGLSWLNFSLGKLHLEHLSQATSKTHS